VRNGRRQKGKGPSPATDVQAKAPPDNEQGFQRALADSSAPTGNGDAKIGVRRKRRRKGQGKGPSSAADGQAQAPQEAQDDSTPEAGGATGERSEPLEGTSAINGEVVGATGKKKQRKRQNRATTSSVADVQAPRPQLSFPDNTLEEQGDPSARAVGSGCRESVQAEN